MTSSVTGLRRSCKALPKPNLHQNKVLVTVRWSPASLTHYSFLNSGETITSEKYAQQIGEMHQKLQCLRPALVLREGPIPSTTKLIARRTTNASEVEQIGPQSCLIRHIHLNSCQPTTTSSNIPTPFCRALFHSHQEAENAFQPRVHRVPKHRFSRYGNKQSYFLLAKMC